MFLVSPKIGPVLLSAYLRTKNAAFAIDRLGPTHYCRHSGRRLEPCHHIPLSPARGPRVSAKVPLDKGGLPCERTFPSFIGKPTDTKGWTSSASSRTCRPARGARIRPTRSATFCTSSKPRLSTTSRRKRRRRPRSPPPRDRK